MVAYTLIFQAATHTNLQQKLLSHQQELVEADRPTAIRIIRLYKLIHLLYRHENVERLERLLQLVGVHFT
jgi:hypothetical protein